MAKDVQKPKSTNYLTKLTSQASPPAINIPPGFFDISDDTVTTTATTTATVTKNQDNFYEITVEEQVQQYDDEHYTQKTGQKKQLDRLVRVKKQPQ